MAGLSHAERETLEIIAKPDRSAPVARGHLEKLSRLDYIEPCAQGVCLSVKGKTFLFKSRKSA